VVLFYDGANDSTYFPQYRTPYGHHDYRSVRALVESYRNRAFGILKPVSAAVYASFTKELVDKITAVATPLARGDPSLAEFAGLTWHRYDHDRKVLSAYGAELLVIWQPLHWVESQTVAATVKELERANHLDPDRFPLFRQNVRNTYDAVALRLGASPWFVDFRNVLCQRRELMYKPDGVHLNDAGRAAVAEALCELLRTRFGY
jgi:hypothetical protein